MVASVSLMRPTSITGLVMSAGTVGTAGTDYFIKVDTATLIHRSNIVDISGDGDLAPRFVVNYWLYADWLIRGWAVSGQSIGVVNMKDTAKNPTGTTLVRFNIAANEGFRGEFFVHHMKVEYHRKFAYVGLAFALKNTATVADGLANYVEV